MSNAQSIEDLLKDPSVLKKGATTSTKKDEDEESSSQKLETKMKGIKLDEMEQETQKKAAQNNVPYISLIGFPISPETISLISKEKAQELKLLCFLYIGEEIRLGALDPTDEKVKELAYQLGEKQRAKAEIYQISQHSFDETIKLYDKIPKRTPAPKGVKITQKELDQYKDIGKDFKKLQETIDNTNITEIVSLIVAAAIQAGASDIHIEAEEKDVKIRFRVDGVLHDAAKIDKDMWGKIISRIKLLAKLKLNITEKPQDGRFQIVLKDEKIDVRTSTIPIAYGESVVMRILKGSAAGLKFDDLGLIGLAQTRLAEQAARPNGMILTTGPTGSGKTTTLYSILKKLNQEGTKIITLEDPIEYRLEGINQSQIDHSKDYSFADGLRSILRQDPDVVMVGEIRDLETADVAINAALTGHLVISTVHTNSAAGAIPRLMSMGVKGFLLAPAINAIIGQRLVRRLCEHCKEEYTPTDDEMKKVKEILDAIPADHPDKPDADKLKFYTAKGCDKCNDLKYKGRIGIYEIFVMNKEIEEIILSEKVSEYQMQDLAIKNQMLTMAQDGLIKASKGITSIEEVFRVSE